MNPQHWGLGHEFEFEAYTPSTRATVYVLVYTSRRKGRQAGPMKSITTEQSSAVFPAVC